MVERQSQRILITKGAPEGIFPLLSGYEVEGKVEPIGEDAIKRIRQTSNELNSQGFRSLGGGLRRSSCARGLFREGRAQSDSGRFLKLCRCAVAGRRPGSGFVKAGWR